MNFKQGGLGCTRGAADEPQFEFSQLPEIHAWHSKHAAVHTTLRSRRLVCAREVGKPTRADAVVPLVEESVHGTGGGRLLCLAGQHHAAHRRWLGRIMAEDWVPAKTVLCFEGQPAASDVLEWEGAVSGAEQMERRQESSLA